MAHKKPRLRPARRSGGRARGEPERQAGGRGRQEPGAGAEEPPPRRAAARPSELKWSPGLLSAREAGGGQPHRGEGQGKVSLEGRPQRPPRRLPDSRGTAALSGEAALAHPCPLSASARPPQALCARAWPLPPPAAPGPGRCRGGRRSSPPPPCQPPRPGKQRRGRRLGSSARGPPKGCKRASDEERGRGETPKTPTTLPPLRANPTATQALDSAPAERKRRWKYLWGCKCRFPPPAATPAALGRGEDVLEGCWKS